MEDELNRILSCFPTPADVAAAAGQSQQVDFLAVRNMFNYNSVELYGAPQTASG